jgi:hypothetical protein
MFCHKNERLVFRAILNTKFCVKLGKKASATCAVLSKAYVEEVMKKSCVFAWHYGSKRACMSKSQMKKCSSLSSVSKVLLTLN